MVGFCISLETYCCSNFDVKHAILRMQFVLLPQIVVVDKNDINFLVELNYGKTAVGYW